MRFAARTVLCLALWVLPASAQVVYENGPINGETDAWVINNGYFVSDTFTVSSLNSTVTGLSSVHGCTQGTPLARLRCPLPPK
jgi:hypothetical protein